MHDEAIETVGRALVLGLRSDRLGLSITSQDVATKLFDLTVNDGPIAIKWLQKSVDVCEDGILGLRTATAVNTSPPNQVLANLRANASNYYNVLALKDPTKYAADLPGWLARLAQS